MPADDGRAEPRLLRRLRTVLLAILLAGVATSLLDLYLLDHTEGFWQQSPLWLLGVGLIAVGLRFAAPGAATMRLLQAVMVAFVLDGAVGVWLHYDGNVAFELEMYPSRAGWELVREALAGATPTLAAAAMSFLGLVGLAYTLEHPLLRRD